MEVEGEMLTADEELLPEEKFPDAISELGLQASGEIEEEVGHAMLGSRNALDGSGNALEISAELNADVLREELIGVAKDRVDG